jgi:transketolase
MAPGDVALLDTLDGWTVHVPAGASRVRVAQQGLGLVGVAGDDRVYVRLSAQTNARPRPVTGEGFLTVRRGGPGAPAVVAVGPMLDGVLAAVEGLDATVLYAATIRPFDGAALRAAVADSPAPEAVLVEPYLAGTSAAAAAAALSDIPHRVLGLGTARAELRRYGTLPEHLAAHGLDPRSLRDRITGFTARAAA